MTGFFLSADYLMGSPWLRQLLSVRVRPTPVVPVGTPIRVVTGDIYAHPLDIIAIEHRNPHDRLDASGKWFAEQIADRFDAAAARLVDAGRSDRATIIASDVSTRTDYESLRGQTELFREYLQHAGPYPGTPTSRHGHGIAIDLHHVDREPWHFTHPTPDTMTVDEADAVFRELHRRRRGRPRA